MESTHQNFKTVTSIGAAKLVWTRLAQVQRSNWDLQTRNSHVLHLSKWSYWRWVQKYHRQKTPLKSSRNPLEFKIRKAVQLRQLLLLKCIDARKCQVNWVKVFQLERKKVKRWQNWLCPSRFLFSGSQGQYWPSRFGQWLWDLENRTRILW